MTAAAGRAFIAPLTAFAAAVSLASFFSALASPHWRRFLMFFAGETVMRAVRAPEPTQGADGRIRIAATQETTRDLFHRA